MTAKVTNIYNLKLTPSQFGQNSIVVNCSQYDSLFRIIQFNLFNGNAVYSIPEGSVVTIRGTKKDNTGFEYECDFYNNVVTFPIQQQITIFPGKVPAELRIVNDGEIIGSWNFLFLIEESPLSNNTIISETDLPLLESALQAASEAENYKNLAEQSADNASASEQNASESEANALTYSQNAQTSANSASQSEANALTYSQNASQSASEAENAKNLANQAISNISTFNTTTYPNAISGLQSEGATQIANVQAEGVTQKGLVTSEGTTQVANVQAKGDEVIARIPEDYTSLVQEVTDIKSDLTSNNAVMLADSVPTNYVFELGAIAGGTGIESDSTVRARTTEFIPYLNDEYIVEVGSEYTCSVIYYDVNKTYKIGHWWFSGTYTVKGYSRDEIQNTKYVRIEIKRTDDGDIDINDLNANVKIGRKVNAPRTYTVNPSGGADFSSLVDAIFVANQHMDSTVCLQNGVYDLLTDLGSDYLNSVDASNRGIYLKNRIRLIGSGDTLITCLYDGSRELTARWLAIFNAGEYGFTLENLRLSGKNIRYVIHDERDSDEDCYVNKYINCRMVFDNTENVYSNAVQCIGGGLGLHGVVVIDNCYFNSINSQNTSIPAVSYHNSADTSSKNGMSLIIISNSFFENNNTVRINYYGNSTKITRAFINNCSLGKDIISGAETSDSSSSNVNVAVEQFNNIIRDDPIITAVLGTLDSGFTNADRCDNLVNVSLMIQGVPVGTSWTDVAYVSIPPTKNQLFTVYDHTNYEALEGYILAGTGHIYMRAKQALSNCSVRAGFSYSIA